MSDIELSIIVPAYNEEANLPGTLNSINKALNALECNSEVIVVDNNSTDLTAKVAENLGAKVVFESFNQIARARNTGGKSAKGKYLIFIDADTIVSDQLIRQVWLELRSNKVLGGGARVEFDHPQRGFALILLKFWQRFSKRAAIAAGCFIYCTSDSFNKVNGFDEEYFASEEIWFSNKLKKLARNQEQTVKIIDKYNVITSSRKSEQPLRILLNAIVFMVFPFAIRFKSLCFLWYRGR
jgi:glycosyltransferase involved in cell wall biosynthesis